MSQDKIELTLEKRTTQGKAVKHLRRDGLVPAVVHDHGKPSVLVQGDYQTVWKTYLQAGKHHPVELKAGAKTYTAMIKDIEFEPKKHTLSHVVFGAVTADEKIEAEVPVHPRYDEGNEASPAERAGLLIITNAASVVVEATAARMPDALVYNGEKLAEVGDHVTVADLDIPAGVTVKTEPETTIATVYEPSAVAAANDAAGGGAEAGEEPALAGQEGEAEAGADGQPAAKEPA